MCDSNVSYGYKATKALDVYIRRLEKRKVADLTEKQINVLLKTARIIRNEISQS
jgi:hypothetical protein